MKNLVLVILPDLDVRSYLINEDYSLNLDDFFLKIQEQINLSNFDLYSITPSLISKLPRNGTYKFHQNFFKKIPEYRLQFLASDLPDQILRVYPKTAQKIKFSNWFIAFDNFNGAQFSQILDIFHHSFSVNYDSIDLSFESDDIEESETPNISLEDEIDQYLDALVAIKIFLKIEISPKDASTAIKRSRILNEIIGTESNYASQLNKLCEVFTPEFFKSINIDDDVYGRTFRFIGDIASVHDKFFKEISKDGDSSESSIGKTFLHYYQLFKISAPFICNYSSVNEEITNLFETNKTFRVEVDKMLVKYFDEANLQSIFVTPVQRLPRYMLLLRDLLKSTPEMHWDYANIKASLNFITELVQSIDAKKKMQDELNFVSDLQIKFGNAYNIMKVGRRGITSVENVKVNNDFKASLYLFNDAILIHKHYPQKFYEFDLLTTKIVQKGMAYVINEKFSILGIYDFFQKYVSERKNLIIAQCSNGKALAWQKVNYIYGPVNIDYTSMTYADDSLYLFGGRMSDGSCSNNLWIRDSSRWILIDKEHAPKPRYGSSLTAISNEKLILFGGQNIEETFDDVYVYRIETFKWSQKFPTFDDPRHKPTPRSSHASTLIGNKLWFFGGECNDIIFFDDLFILDLKSFKWKIPTINGNSCPEPRAWCKSFTFKDKRNNPYFAIFGGFNYEQENYQERRKVFNDVWAFSISEGKWIKVEIIGETPIKRYGYAGEFINDSFYIIGGQNTSSQKIPPQKLELIFTDDHFVFKCSTLPQCDEPEAFIYGTSTFIPKSGIALFNASSHLQKIKLVCENAESPSSPTTLKIRESKKKRRRITGSLLFSTPFCVGKANTVSMKIGNDEEFRFSLDFDNKKFYQNCIIDENKQIFWRKSSIINLYGADFSPQADEEINQQILSNFIFAEKLKRVQNKQEEERIPLQPKTSIGSPKKKKFLSLRRSSKSKEIFKLKKNDKDENNTKSEASPKLFRSFVKKSHTSIKDLMLSSIQKQITMSNIDLIARKP